MDELVFKGFFLLLAGGVPLTIVIWLIVSRQKLWNLRQMMPVNQSISGRPIRVLVAEDEAVVAMLIEAELGDAGYNVIGPFATCADASHWLTSDMPDIALLGHTLHDGPCTDVAVELRRRGVPFVALTGSDLNELPDAFRDAPYLEKPVGDVDLPKFLSRVLTSHQAASSLLKADTTASTE